MNIRRKIRIIAIALVLGYSIVRFFLVKAMLARYGVDPWLFLLLDASSGVWYIIGLEYLIVALRSKKRSDSSATKLLIWSTVAASGFMTPYLYIYISSRELPSSLGIGLGVIILLLVLNSLVGIVRRVRQDSGTNSEPVNNQF